MNQVLVATQTCYRIFATPVSQVTLQKEVTERHHPSVSGVETFIDRSH
jgi:hypothetical protein